MVGNKSGSGRSAAPAFDDCWGPLEAALIAFHDRGEPATVLVSSDLGEPEHLPASIFFRTESELEEWEHTALDRCGDRILDVGAGVGAHALILQKRGRYTTALEALPGAVRIMGERGVADARLGRLSEMTSGPAYDTVMLLMNGSMLAETLSGLDQLLDEVGTILRPGGNLLMDSTDLRDRVHGSEEDFIVDGRYLGELHFQLSYDGRPGPVFPQLFVDPEMLEARARSRGWSTTVIWSGEGGRFLAELARV